VLNEIAIINGKGRDSLIEEGTIINVHKKEQNREQ